MREVFYMCEKLNFNKGGKVLNFDILMRTPKLILKKESKNLGVLYFMECLREEAKEMIEYGHYSHSFQIYFGKINIGVYKEGRLIGVASFGNLMNTKDYKKFSDDFCENSVIELNRMWVSDELGKNAETLLLANAVKILKSLRPEIKLIQSFSDGRLGCGIVYQAANFKYYGYHESIFAEDLTDGKVYHKMTLNNFKNNRAYDLLCKCLTGEARLIKVNTYRYLYALENNFVCKLKELPFPKEAGGFEVVDLEYSLSIIEKALKGECFYTYKNGRRLEELYEEYLSSVY